LQSFDRLLKARTRDGHVSCPAPTRHRHLYLHWIMQFSQIISGVGVSVSVSCPMCGVCIRA